MAESKNIISCACAQNHFLSLFTIFLFRMLQFTLSKQILANSSTYSKPSIGREHLWSIGVAMSEQKVLRIKRVRKLFC